MIRRVQGLELAGMVSKGKRERLKVQNMEEKGGNDNDGRTFF